MGQSVETFELEDPTPRWRAPWFFFCGNCTPTDCTTSCTAYFMPCVAYGYTTSKVFHTSFWREVLRFVLIFGIVGVISFAWSIASALVCPAQLDPESDVAVMTNSCFAMAAVGNLISLGSFACAIFWAWYVGGPRRTQLRKLLGIPDSGAGGDCCTCCPATSPNKGARSDKCLHFWCLCCALAQEMRTVRYLQMAGKLPPTVPEGYEPLISHQAPEVDGGMNRAAEPAKGEALV